jgi:phage shock protein B
MDNATLAILMPYVSDMAGDVSELAMVLLFVGIPAWLIVQLYRIRAGQRLHKADEAALRAMAGRMAQVEQRMASLERVLDSEAPRWRASFEDGGQYGRQAG